MSTTPEQLDFGGAAPLRGRLRVPGDKSISHRALLFAALASGRSELTHLATGEDVHATRLALGHLGVKARTKGEIVTVQSSGAAGLREPEAVLDCGNSGTTLRIISGVLARCPFLTVLTGDASLRTRPMLRVIEPLRAMGATADGRDGGEHAPIAIRGGQLRGVRHELPVAWAQVKSALLVAGLGAEGVTEVVSPAPSRDHTERMLAALGVPLEVDGLAVRVRAGEPEAFALDVPGDPSSAAFFVVAASITPRSEIVLEDVSINPTRLGFVDVLLRMGADIEIVPSGDRCGEPVGDIVVRAAPLHGTVIEGDEIPNVQDEVPVLAMAAAFADGVTEVRDAAELAAKESNRIGTVHQELTQLGIGVEPRADGLVIRGGQPHSGLLKSHGDHRIAMAVAVAAHAIDGSTTVRGWGAVASSYPEFAEHLAALTGGA
ncbi:MAG: 3-phosphoshikimate 1-carboxyvinyltransferase [Actinomycetota bacterium]|nr:3-phosphoshikimate 1-carboxyvinyltransferase [Actinomycetota bacterium]